MQAHERPTIRRVRRGDRSGPLQVRGRLFSVTSAPARRWYVERLQPWLIGAIRHDRRAAPRPLASRVIVRVKVPYSLRERDGQPWKDVVAVSADGTARAARLERALEG